jgi:flagellar motility protein MotE (MotC chaperone)
MNIDSLPVRRMLTLIGVVLALVVGFAAIQAAKTWTVDAAPLDAAPVSATEVQNALVDEQARSAELQAQLAQLAANSEVLTQALQAAQERIDADTDTATTLRQDLKDAKAKLAKLQRSIRNAPPIRTVVTTTRTTTAAPATHSGEHEGEDDEHEHGDD